MRSEFITDVEQQYEVYCKIAEEYGFIDLNAKKNGFRCTTKSNEFNAGWIAFTGAIAAMREDQQAKIDELQKRIDGIKKIIREAYESEGNSSVEIVFDEVEQLEQALKGWSTLNLNTDENGECRHFSTTMFADGKAECFHCNAVVNEKREVIGKQSKGLNQFFTKTFSKDPK